MVRPVHQPASIAGEEGSAVIAVRGRYAGLARTVQVHGPQVQVSRRHRRVHDLAGLPIDGPFGIVAGSIGEPLRFRAVHIRQEQVVAGVDRPDVALAAVRARRALVPRQMRRGVQDAAAVRQEVAAGGDAAARRDHALVRAVRVHDVDLVAGGVSPRGLKHKLGAVRRPVGLGVLASERQLADLGEEGFRAGRRFRRGRTVPAPEG